MSTAPRIESELDRRYLITVEPSGVVHVYDTDEAVPGSTILPPRDGWPVFSTYLEEHALELVRGVAVRTRDGDGWILRCPWSGSLRDVGDLRYKLGLAFARVLGGRAE
jgi:hypothetical protein